MISCIKKRKNTFIYRVFSAFTACVFTFSIIVPPSPTLAQTVPQSILNLPLPSTMVSLTPSFNSPLIRGITIRPENPLKFDFLVSQGDDLLSGEQFRSESKKLIKYFLAALTVPDDELWVNLSPYEKNRIIPTTFGQTEMGRDMLAQDYMLKQLTSSLMYPEDDLGQEFWDRVHKKAYEKFGTSEIPMNTFNKIWIVPEKVVVYEHDQTAFVVESHLKVMLEEDYEALRHEMGNAKSRVHGNKKSGTRNESLRHNDVGANNYSPVRDDAKIVSGVSSEIVKEILVPEIEKEINEGKIFTQLRQIYNSVILATWYKDNLKESLLGKIYIDLRKD